MTRFRRTSSSVAADLPLIAMFFTAPYAYGAMLRVGCKGRHEPSTFSQVSGILPEKYERIADFNKRITDLWNRQGLKRALFDFRNL